MKLIEKSSEGTHTSIVDLPTNKGRRQTQHCKTITAYSLFIADNNKMNDFFYLIEECISSYFVTQNGHSKGSKVK